MSQAVFYFGGYLASQLNIDAWVRTAKQQKPSVEFIGFPWPKGASSGDESAVNTFRKAGTYDSVIKNIQNNRADTIYIVGHSSGCAIANAVDASLKSTDKIVLVALDGFTPNAKQLDRETTQVWGAVCDGVHSRNYPKSSLKGRRRIYTAHYCKTQWALHFSLVNAAATDSSVHNVATGYANCQANLLFL